MLSNENDNRIINSFSFLITIIKKNQEWNFSLEASNQLIIISIPTDSNENIEFHISNLKALVKSGVGSYLSLLEANSQSKSLSQNFINNAKIKIRNLLIDIQGLHQITHTPQLLADIPTSIQDWLNDHVEKNDMHILEDDDELLNDTHFLNSLQSLVNRWVKQIKDVTQLDSNPIDGSIQDEIDFWNEKENILESINDQLSSPQITLILNVLKNSKRSHSITSLISNLSVKSSLKIATINNEFLKLLKIKQLYGAESMDELQVATEEIFEVFKKLKHSKYPITKAIDLLKMITHDYEIELIAILTKENLFVIENAKFDRLYQDLIAQLNIYDSKVRNIINLMRSILRQQDEIFVPIKITTPIFLKEKMMIIKNIRDDHEEFNNSISSLLEDNSSFHEDQFPIYQKLHNESQVAYDLLSGLNSKVIFENDSQILKSHKTNYYQQISFIERRLIAVIKNILLDAKNNSEVMFSIFMKFRTIINKPQVRLMLQPFRSILLQEIEKELKCLEVQFAYQSQIANIMNVKNLPEFSGKVIWIKQIVNEVSKIFCHLELILTDNWSNYPEGKPFSTKITKLLSEIDIDNIFDEWVKYTNRRMSKTFLKSPILTEKIYKTGNTRYVLNIDYEDLEICKEIKCLKLLGLQIPHSIILYSENVRSIKKFASLIDETIMQFYGITSKINELEYLKILVEPEIESIFSIITILSNKKWMDITKVVASSENEKLVLIIYKFQESVFGLADYITTLTEIKLQYSMYIKELEDCEYNLMAFSKIIYNIQCLLQDVLRVKSKACDTFIEAINKQIENTLFSRYKHELELFYKEWNDEETLISKFKRHQILVYDLSIIISPPLEASISYYLNHLNNIVYVIKKLKKIQVGYCDIDTNTQNQNCFDFTNYSTNLFYKKCFDTLFDKIDMSNEYLQGWKSLQFLWDYDILKIIEADEYEMDVWFQILTKFQVMRRIFDTIETSKRFGLLQIEYEQAQSRVYNKFDSKQHEIIEMFGQEIQKYMNRESNDLKELKKNNEKLTFDLSNTNSIIDLLASVSITKDILESKKKILNDLKLGEAQLQKYRYKFPSVWVFYNQINDDTRAILSLNSNNEIFIASHKDSIQSIIQNEIQNLYNEYTIIKMKWKSEKPGENSTVENAISILQYFENSFNDLNTKYKKLRDSCRILDLTVQISVEDQINEIKQLQYIWGIIIQLYNVMDNLQNISWISFDIGKVKMTLQDALLVSKSLPTNVRSYPALENAQVKIRHLLKQFTLLNLLKNSKLDDSHWNDIFEHVKLKKAPEVLGVNDVLELDLLNNEIYIKSVVDRAESESLLDSTVAEIENSWKNYKFNVYKIRTDVSLISGGQELLTKIEDDINTLESIKISPFSVKFNHRIKLFEDKLNILSQIMSVWLDAQRQWIHLSGIFKAKEQFGQSLPLDLTRFENISHEFMFLTSEVLSLPTVIDVIDIPDIFPNISRLLESLSNIRKSLISFLEKQRESFPRFYFVGNDDMLELIGNSTDIMIICKHIKNIFPGISSLLYNNETLLITGIISAEGEEVNLIESISLVKNIGLVKWLQVLEKSIKFTLSSLLVSLCKILDEKLNAMDLEILENILDNYPNQIIILAFQIYWTKTIEKALSLNELPRQLEILKEKAEILTNLIPTKISTLKRIKIENLLIEFMHKSDVIRNLHDEDGKLDSFIWFSEVKFYLIENSETGETNNVYFKQGNYTSFYGFEYLGAVKKLAYTPVLTSVHVILSQALNQHLGGLLLGPAGTGKTESVKSLGYDFGRTVFVFCCDETFDVESVSRILIGLTQIGGWGCFDEFNRLEENILSGISTQIEKIQNSFNCTKPLIEISGKSFLINKFTGIFITNNPNYEGRSTLPDNIKSKFLTYSLTVPDSEKIAGVLLTTQGFSYSSSISSLLIDFFEKMNTRCSKQKHYDFALRNLKMVITHAGKLMRNMHHLKSDEELELKILQRSCYDVVLPRLINEDENIFLQEVKSFKVEYQLSPEHDKLKSLLVEIAKAKSLIILDDWLLKCMQIYEIQKLNSGFILYGPSCSGKSVIFGSLVEAISKLHGKKNECYKINAKVLTKNTLFGELDYTTREWKDGIFTSILREVNENKNNNDIWIIFDCDIDPNWVENLNSVLDDNKLLTLPTGERIPLASNIKVVIETDSLMHTTPATITRCGVIAFNKPFVGIHDLLKNELSKFLKKKIDNEESHNEMLAIHNLSVGDFKDMIVNKAVIILDRIIIEKVYDTSKKFVSVLDTSPYQIISTLGRLLNTILRKILIFVQNEPLQVRGDYSTYINRELLMAVIWSFGGEFTTNNKKDFIMELLQIPKLQHIFETLDAEQILYANVTLPHGDIKAEKLENIELQPHIILKPDTVIATYDTMLYEKYICSILEQHEPLILCGPPGSGKTMFLLSSIRRSISFELIAINFSKETTINSIIKSLEQQCDYKKQPNGVVLSPKIPGKWIILFCDEMNLPEVDKYGSQKVIQFLRQLIIEKGFWHSKECTWVSFKNIQFVGACNPVSISGRVSMTCRLTNFCTIFMIDYPSHASLKRIYNVYMKSVFKTIPDLIGYSDTFSDLIIEIYMKYQKHFKNSTKPHYFCSPRELTRWVKGLYIALKSSTSYNMQTLLRLCVYEGLRLFSDRLMFHEEKECVFSIIFNTTKTFFPHLDISTILSPPILFSDWLNYEYQPVNCEKLRKFVTEKFNVFSEEESNVNIVLYDELLDHALRIDRVLKNVQGHMILVGPSGSGKTTIAKFVSWMNGISVFQLNVSKKYSLDNFDKTLKNLLLRASVGQEQICCIIDESTILETSFLEKMNTLLANAEVPGLFEGDEYDNLIDSCLKTAKENGLLLDTTDEIYKWFVQQVADNFHVIFTMTDPYASEVNPFISSTALFNRCVVNWMGSWSQKTLETISQELLINIPLDKSNYKFQDHEGSHYGLRSIVTKIFVTIHMNAIASFSSGVGSSQFLSLLRSFSSIYIENQNSLQVLNSHVDKGLTKIKETFLKVKQLKITMSEKEKALHVEDEKARNLLDKMITDQNESERKQDLSVKMQELFAEQEKVIISRRETVVHELNYVEKLIEEAQKGVLDIKKPHLTELRSMHNPPETIKLVLESICIMLGYDVHNWKDVQHVIRQDDFIAGIINFKGEKQLTQDLLSIMHKNYLTKSNFNFDSANRASKACGPLFMWIEAQLKFSEIAVKVGPLKHELKKLENELVDTKAKLIAINSLIKDLNDEIERYKFQYSETIRAKEKIKIELQNVEDKLKRSIKLLSSLTGERERWEKNIYEYKHRNDCVVGDSILSSAFITYCGNLIPSKRNELYDSWKLLLQNYDIQFDSSVGTSKFASLVSTEKIIEWEKQGMPNDEQFIGNTSIMMSPFNEKYSYIIDPNDTIVQFLSKLIDPKKLVVTSFLDPEFEKKLENCVKFGGTILIKDGEYYDPIINRLIAKDFRVIGAGRMIVNLGEKTIDMSSEFKLYIHTRDSNTNILPFVSSRMNILNYSFTMDTVINEALNLTLEVKEPEIENKRITLVKQNTECVHQVQVYEQELLTLLSSCENNLLDDDKLLTKLEIIKQKTEQLEFQILESDRTMVECNLIRNDFKSLGDFYARLITVLDEFSSINSIYQYSKIQLENILLNTLNFNLESNVDEIKSEFSKMVYRELSISLLQQDRDLLKKILQNLSGIDDFENMSIGDSFLASPIILLRSNRGNDSTILVKELSRSNSTELITYSMGSPDGPKIANKMIMELKETKRWLVIENIEISSEFLELVSETITVLKSFIKSGKPEFKLILTCKMEANIPPLLVQTCKQIIIENEQGLKGNLCEQLLSDTSSLNINKLNDIKPKPFKKIFFILVWFYSVIVSKLRFRKGGFSKQYELNQVDLRNAENFIKNIIDWKYNKKKDGKNIVNNYEIDSNIFDIIGKVICSLIFGGKFDNPNDLKLLTESGFSLFRIDMLDTNFNLLKFGGSEKLYAPESFNTLEYIEWIKELPEIEPMDWLGLPDDAEQEKINAIEARNNQLFVQIMKKVN